jgi:hypothetical protein
MGSGSPGNMSFVSKILNDRKDPTKIPIIEAKDGKIPKLRSMWPESME